MHLVGDLSELNIRISIQNIALREMSCKLKEKIILTLSPCMFYYTIFNQPTYALYYKIIH
jgi:hypothetical protein